ncbi:uncharacterized protein [Choristoneura fumiferana]|uniref:uncharacterized protein n=1 Tax=Choristoneura fumiferana TaxID=7141 RepID=UPI003D159A59
MDLQAYLVDKFESWHPPPPIVEGRTKGDITLRWDEHPFSFLEGDLIYRVQKKEKMPPWMMVYNGGKTTKTIDNLEPRHPHKFRIQVILRGTAIANLAEKAVKHFGNKKAVLEQLENYQDGDAFFYDKNKTEDNVEGKILDENENKTTEQACVPDENGEGDSNIVKEEELPIYRNKNVGAGDVDNNRTVEIIPASEVPISRKWLESQWSEATSTSTDTDGTSAVCFCMAVRCGYLKQVQIMLEERPALLEIINSTNGFTPLATAIRKGDINTVKFLLAAGADPNQPSSSGQTPLHLATLGSRVAIVDLLLDKGADFEARDLNGLRVEHYAVDSGSEEMVNFVLQRGGDVHARDYTGWTPLFRAVTQGASTELIEALVLAGSDVDTTDYAGLALCSIARLLTNRQSRSRDSVLRLVDSSYPHEQAVANFTRLTKKISSLNTILK